MRRLFKGFGFVCVLAVAAAAPPPEPSPEEEERKKVRVREAVRQLGSPEYRDREAATMELQELGEVALPDLREATGSPDPEVRRRAQWLLMTVLRAAGKSKSTGLTMTPVLPGEFEMGSPKSERLRQPDEALHPVRITRSFLIGTYEVTQDEYRKVTKTNPSWFSATGGGKEKVRALETGRFPVEQVSWFDALDFCNRLSELDGYPPYYKLADVKRDADGSITAAAVTVPGGRGYRLPTEAEWEFACRAWTRTMFHYGQYSSGRELNAKVVTPGGYGGPGETIHLGRTAAVGAYKPNRRGLYDMHANVGEWCADWYDKDYYANSPADDPPGPEKGTHRAVRGGSWLVSDTSCRSAVRAMLVPGDRTYTVGFRVARTP